MGANVSIPKPHHAAIAIDIVIGKTARATPRHLVPPCEKMPYVLINVVVDRPIVPLGVV